MSTLKGAIVSEEGTLEASRSWRLWSAHVDGVYEGRGKCNYWTAKERAESKHTCSFNAVELLIAT